MIFQWDPDVPLVVDENIELPQLQLIKNYTADCTQVYSTGNFTCLEVVFVLKRRLGYYLFHTYIPTCLIVIMSVSSLEKILLENEIGQPKVVPRSFFLGFAHKLFNFFGDP